MKLIILSTVGISKSIWLLSFFFVYVTTYAQQPPNFTNDLVSTGWNEIEGFVWDGNGQQYVWEKEGKVWVIDTTGNKLPTPLINISAEVGNWRDHGLNSVALDPDFLNNGYFYLFYTVDRHHLLYFGTPSYNAASNEYFNATISRVTRYTANSATNFTTVVPGSRLVLIGQNKKNGIPLLYESHGAGSILFGTDGSLLITTGEGAYYNAVDKGSYPQTYYVQALADSIILPKENVGSFRSLLPDCLAGKILRVDAATGQALESNPFYDPERPDAPVSKVYALGLRNPFRVTLRPGTGSTDITAGFPGVLYIGDVGWDNWEDINICTQPGQNFGWPLYEGLTPQPGYMSENTQNLDEPNPLNGTGGCTQQYFRFKDLLKQATLDPAFDFNNPCNNQVPIDDSVLTFLHTRPVIEYHHGYLTGAANTGIWDGYDADEIAINDPASPIQGDTFPGFASLAGVWYNDVRFPPAYQNTYFHGDFVGGWIRNMIIDSVDVPSQINAFAGNTGYITYIGLNPNTGCINYARYPNEVREICYTGVINNLPIAVVEVDTSYGFKPLLVQFTGDQSSDPEFQPLSYSWNFGDGGTSSQMNPNHNYNPPGNNPVTYYAVLTVTDNIGQTAKDSVLISVNNTPPEVQITSFDDGDLYSIGQPTNLSLIASVTDAEHPPGQLFYEWTTFLHHNNHYHAEAVDTNKVTSTIISPVGCEPGVTYYFRIQLKVTDAAGLSTTVNQNIYPACDIPEAAFTASVTSLCKNDTVFFSNNSNGLADSFQWFFEGGTPATSTSENPIVVYNSVGTFDVRLIVENSIGTDTMFIQNYVQVFGLPQVTVTSPGGGTSFCAGSPFFLTAVSPNNNIIYQWLRNGIELTGATDSILNVTKSGNYKVKVVNNKGCNKISTKSVITKLPLPIASISANGPVTFCPGDSVQLSALNGAGNTYQWIKYSSPIAGSTGLTYFAKTTGAYKVQVTGVNGCSKMSNKINVTANCFSRNTEMENLNSLKVYPNPTGNFTYLEFFNLVEEKINISLSDISGRIMLKLSGEAVENLNQIGLDCNQLNPGYYLIRVEKASGTLSAGLIVAGTKP